MRRAAVPVAPGISHLRPPEARTTLTTWPGCSRTVTPSSATVSNRWPGRVPCPLAPPPGGVITGLVGIVTATPGAAVALPADAAIPGEPAMVPEPVPQAKSPVPVRPMTMLRAPVRKLMILGRQAPVPGSVQTPTCAYRYLPDLDGGPRQAFVTNSRFWGIAQ